MMDKIMKKFLIITVLIISLSNNLLLAENINLQENNQSSENWRKMYPLNDDDYWVYSAFGPGSWFIGYHTVKVISDTLIDSTLYKKIAVKSEYSNDIHYSFQRIDTSSYICNWIYDHSEMFLKLDVSEGDTFSTGQNWCEEYACVWEVTEVFYYSDGKYMSYYWDYLTATTHTLQENIGITSSWYEGGGHYDLKGCLVDGVLVGDTSTIDLKIDELSVPDEYKLDINAYPNPFNSTVTIDFSINSEKNTSLKIFDLLGHHIKSFNTNDFNNQRKHYIKWNGKNSHGNNVPTGIYFVVLTNGKSKVTKQILLLH